MNMVIKDYLPSYKEEVLALFRMNVPDYFDQSEEAGLINYLDHEVESYFVVLIDDKLVGSGGINSEWEDGASVIAWDMIHPEYQGKGIGMQLLKHRISLLKQLDPVPLIRVRTSQHTFGFYEKGGFVLQEVIPDYWAPGFDLYDMIYGS